MQSAGYREKYSQNAAELLRELNPMNRKVALLAPEGLFEEQVFRAAGFAPVLCAAVPGEGSFGAAVLGDLRLLEGGGVAALWDWCAAQKLFLVVVQPNLSHNDHVFALMGGQDVAVEGEGPGFAPLTAARLEHAMAGAGFAPLAGRDLRFDSRTQFEQLDNVLAQKSTLAYGYLSWLKGHFDAEGSVYAFVRAYSAAGATRGAAPMEPGEARRPFLSVVTRTQGNRPAELREALLCLLGQSDEDFEVLVVGHKVPAENLAAIETVLAELPDSLRARARYIAVDTGNRSAPLNAGFAAARGEYIAILDDDDLVMDHWVECFHKQAKKTPGATLHAYAVKQDWERGALPDALAAVGKPENKYCSPFNYVRQTVENYCPTMSLAFPGWLFRHSSLRFDESLNTTEDWDFIMKAVLVTGVADIPEVTSVYRLWQNAESSFALHDETHWKDNYNVVKSRLNAAPMLMPPGSAGKLDDLYMATKKLDDFKKRYSYIDEDGYASLLYINTGSGYNQGQTMKEGNRSVWPAFRYRYEFSEEYRGALDLRFDPVDHGEVAVDALQITLISDGGERREIPLETLGTNGFLVQDKIFFIRDDPQVNFAVPQGFAPAALEVSGILLAPLPPEQLEVLADYIAGLAVEKPSFARRVARRLRRMVRGG